MTIIIRNGNVVTEDRVIKTDLLLKDGIIEQRGGGFKDTYQPDVSVDASGLFVLPGGIDPHVHFHLPNPAGYSADDFHSGSTAALFGGTTCVIDFVTPAKGQKLPDALRMRIEEARPSLIDYSFHVSPISWHKTIPSEIEQCVEAGITSFKVYMAYLDTIGLQEQDLKPVFESIHNAGGKVLVHCELGGEVNRLTDNFLSKGCTSPFYHPLSRPGYVEAKAVEKAISIARETGCALYIVHVSAKESIQHIEKAQQEGLEIYAETCPQYLLLDDSKYNADFDAAATYVMSPPLRKKEDNLALWEAISAGTIQSIGTDHCSFTLKQKQRGRHDYSMIPNGAGGVEHRMSLLYHFGVSEGLIDIRKFVELTSTNPAKIFGLYPRKGAIKEGADADLVLWNPEKETRISAASHHQKCDINIYEGIEIKGAPEYVFSGGKVALKNDALSTTGLAGRFLSRRADETSGMTG
jgi:dihydropyrimidinase